MASKKLGFKNSIIINRKNSHNSKICMASEKGNEMFLTGKQRLGNGDWLK